MKKILDYMKKDGYFKKGNFEELSEEQEIRNYEKTKVWIKKGIVPQWLREDIDYYQTKLNK